MHLTSQPKVGRPFTCVRCWHFFSFAPVSFSLHFFAFHHISNLVNCMRFIPFNASDHYQHFLPIFFFPFNAGDHYQHFLPIVFFVFFKVPFCHFFVLFWALLPYLFVFLCLAHHCCA